MPGESRNDHINENAKMTKTNQETNKALVLEHFDTLFNKTRLRGGCTLLVGKLYSTQRPHRAWADRPIQPD